MNNFNREGAHPVRWKPAKHYYQRRVFVQLRSHAALQIQTMFCLMSGEKGDKLERRKK